MSESRSVRKSTKSKTELSNRALELRERMILARKKMEEENIKRFINFFEKSYTMSITEKKENIDYFAEKNMIKYNESWRKFVLECIEKDDLASIIVYLEHYINKFSINEMEFMTEILDTMRDKNRDYIFWQRPLWNKLKEKGMTSTNWWAEHIKHSFHNSGYIHKLISNNWDYLENSKIEYFAIMPPETTTYIVNDIYKKDNLFKFRFNGTIEQKKILMYGQRPTRTDEERKSVKFYIKYLIQKRNSILPPLIVDTIQRDGVVTYDFDNLYSFINLCIDTDEKDILNELIKVFDIKRQENDKWLKFLIECIIRPSYMKQYKYIDDSFNIKNAQNVVAFIISSYKININNIYMDMQNLFSRQQPIDPIKNPKSWLDKNIPVIAWAILYKNIDAIKYFLNLGAKLNRCVISMEDLTDDPRILGLFTRDTKASKIQRSYLQYYYSPTHKSQAERVKTYTEKYDSKKLSLEPILEKSEYKKVPLEPILEKSEGKSGGKKVKNTKK